MNFSDTSCVICYRPHSKASKGYVFTGVCHSFCSMGGGGGGGRWSTPKVNHHHHNPPPTQVTPTPPGTGHNTYPRPPGTWSTTTPSPPGTWSTTTPSPPGTGYNTYPPPSGTGHNTYPPPPTWDMVNHYPLSPPWDMVNHYPSPPPGHRSQHLPPPLPPSTGTWSTITPLPPHLGHGQPLRRRAVRILLECILVHEKFAFSSVCGQIMGHMIFIGVLWWKIGHLKCDVFHFGAVFLFEGWGGGVVFSTLKCFMFKISTPPSE